jgi:hypothetical protein
LGSSTDSLLAHNLINDLKSQNDRILNNRLTRFPLPKHKVQLPASDADSTL